MNTQPHDQMEIDDPSPMMVAWRKDADEFGIPFQVQKGLMFLTAFGLKVSYQAGSAEEMIGFVQRLSNKISGTAPHIPENEGLAYSRRDITALLTEFAKRFMGEGFTPRSYAPASLRAGQTFEIEGKTYISQDGGWSWDGVEKLPECLCEGMWRMGDWDEAMTSLCDQIGGSIGMNLEGAYFAGFIFFERQYKLDPKSTLQIAELVSGMLPPKFMWFRHILNFEAEMAGQGNCMQKVLDCFLVGIPNEAPLLYRLVTFLSDQLHYKGPGQKNQRMWDASLVQFACVVLSQRNWFSSDAVGYFSDYGAPPPDGPESDRQGIPALIEYLEEKEWEVPDPCSSLEEALAAVAAQIEARWGYRIMDEDEDLTPADSWTRRACILHVYTVNTILSPDWNKFE